MIRCSTSTGSIAGDAFGDHPKEGGSIPTPVLTTKERPINEEPKEDLDLHIAMREEIDMNEIPPGHKCRLKGKYARGIDRCPHCDHRHDDVKTKPEHWIGMAEWNAEGLPVRSGVVVVRECEECFRYFFHHAGKAYYENYVRGDLYHARGRNTL